MFKLFFNCWSIDLYRRVSIVRLFMMKKTVNSLLQVSLSYNAKKALVKGITVGAATALIYLAIVIITTPNLPASATINAAFKINSIVIIGLALGVGIQFFLTSYSKGLGCRLDNRRKGIFGGGSGSTVLSSFFSFFSLVPLGCCGSWLLILSMLPSIFGSSLSAVLIEYSKLLSYMGLAIVFGFAGLSALKLKKELEDRNKNFNQLNDQHLTRGNNNNKKRKKEVRI
jgi:hypothetical protein